ncbi:Wzz/FepE/Etk N-terminal domain-containing protein [Thiohalomonas denitrificans]|uniref:Chain length determinant protein n=1 Tax=Thiohalomonas denitrificans TaxID=415747 RepID=A0A1G5R0S1_9GAMM|nr:Wzz/FepE/Etk N-terminal domain-containing protein [Thiohalomonas denitrificans]SCZ67410.1 Chain length determinant protein [Thiohalomonas denitrificans]
MNLPDKSAPESLPEFQRYADNENGLVDLWLILVRRRLLIAAVALFFGGLGVAFALVKSQEYSYSTTIEIGNRLVKDDVRPVEPPEAVQAKIETSHLPMILQQYRQVDPDANTYEFTARIPRSSRIVVLEAKGPLEKKETYLALLSSVVQKVQEDHQRIKNEAEKEMEIRRERIASTLASLESEEQLLKREAKRMEEVRALLERQVGEIHPTSAETNQNRVAAVNQTDTDLSAMTMMLLNNEIRVTRDRLMDNLRAQSEQRDEMSKLEIERINFEETRALVPPMQSLDPIGLDRKVIIVVSLIFGLMAGVFAAFFASFLSQVRKIELNNQ